MPAQIEEIAKHVATAKRQAKSEPRSGISVSDSEEIRNFPSTEQISEALHENGFIKVEGCFSRKFVEAIKADVEAHRFYLNRNGLTGVYSDTQYYFVNLLAASRTFVSFITSQKLKNALTSYFPGGCRLKALRYYETYGGHHMQWHTDNKTARGFAEIPGLIFIFYCEDVVDGEFQYIRGSHKWSSERGFNDYSDEYITKNHGDEIVKFAGPAGTLVIYNTYGIHRAKPVKRRDYVRKSVFFQVDAAINDGETLIVNPSLFDPSHFADQWLFKFLGFGAPSTYGVWPRTDIADVPLRSLAPHIFNFIRRRPKRVVTSLLPRGLKQKIKAKVR